MRQLNNYYGNLRNDRASSLEVLVNIGAMRYPQLYRQAPEQIVVKSRIATDRQSVKQGPVLPANRKSFVH